MNQSKNVKLKWVQPNFILLKSHVRWEKGPTRGPGAHRLLVGGPMSAHGANFLEAKRKKFKSRLNLQRLSRYLS